MSEAKAREALAQRAQAAWAQAGVGELTVTQKLFEGH